jgi:ATP-dependent Clp protease ATP-binding subunit ClpX
VRAPEERQTGDLLQDTEPEDLLKFGLIPEFVGRVPVVATLHDLDKDALVDILTKPKNALVKQYQRLFEMEGVELEFTEGALEAVAEKAIARGAGARGLRSIMENVLLEPMFELPGFEDVERLTVNREVIEGTGQPVFTYRDSQKQSQGGG